MAILDIRQRSGYLFLGVILGHILLISTQVNSATGVPILESVTFSVFSEIQRIVTTATAGVSGAWSGYVALRHVRADNEALKRRLAEAEVALQEQRAVADRARGLQQLLDLRDRTELRTTAAAIIGGAASADFRTVTIDKGTSSGLKPDLAVIAPAGVVGRVVVSGARASKVQLLIDRNAAAGVIIERSRAQGVVMGAGDGGLLLEYMSDAFDVEVGDEIVTSGIDGIYPKGLPIGQIGALEKSGGSYKRITVKPAVDFGRLEEVLVVLTPSPLQETGGTGPATKE